MNVSRIRSIFRIDLRVSLRDGEQLLLTLGLPVLLLVFFSLVDVLPTGQDDAVDYLAPGVLALALLSVAFVRQAISLGFDRGFGALRRLALTPLKPSEFLIAKSLTTLVLFVGQVIILGITALVLGWRPEIHPAVVLTALLGLACFNALAYALASRFEGLAALAVANALYIVLLLISGLIVDLDEFPSGLAAAVKFLPPTALAALLRANLDAGVGPGWAWLCLGCWTIAAAAVARFSFRWI